LDLSLIRGAAAAAALDLDHRLQVRQSLLEHVHARLARPRLHEIHRTVEDALGGRLLPLVHQRVDELADGLAIVARVGEYWALHGSLPAAHFFLPPAAA